MIEGATNEKVGHKQCLNCVTIDRVPEKVCYTTREVWRTLLSLLGFWSAVGFLRWLVQNMQEDSGMVFTVVLFTGVVIMAIIWSLFVLMRSVYFFIWNVGAHHRGFYLFLDQKKKLHVHFELPIGTAHAATPVIIGVWIGRWFRKGMIIGPAAKHWRLVKEPTPYQVIVEDMNGCRLPGGHDPARVLAQIAKYESVLSIIDSAEVRATVLDMAFNELGIGVQMTIMAAIASKDAQRSPQTKALRERLEELLVDLSLRGYLEKERITKWSSDEAQAQLMDANHLARINAATSRVREKPGEAA